MHVFFRGRRLQSQACCEMTISSLIFFPESSIETTNAWPQMATGRCTLITWADLAQSLARHDEMLTRWRRLHVSLAWQVAFCVVLKWQLRSRHELGVVISDVVVVLTVFSILQCFTDDVAPSSPSVTVTGTIATIVVMVVPTSHERKTTRIFPGPHHGALLQSLIANIYQQPRVPDHLSHTRRPTEGQHDHWAEASHEDRIEHPCRKVRRC